jgi:FPC/CPF motif-containing protein YcgG
LSRQRVLCTENAMPQRGNPLLAQAAASMSDISSRAEVQVSMDRPWNPLATGGRVAPSSSYAAWSGVDIIHPIEPHRKASRALWDMHAELRERILYEGYPCVGARSALNRRNYRFGLYPSLNAPETAAALCHDLYEFNHEFENFEAGFFTFIAGFEGPDIDCELTFERLLWEHLQCLHEVDRQHFVWDARVNRDPDHPKFSFSIGGRGFFVVGLHPRASRKARTSSRPVLAFNAHEQFESLRVRGKFEMMKQMIRGRDFAFQGSINPVLQDYGEASEARQYSGREVPDEWTCPFIPKTEEP